MTEEQKQAGQKEWEEVLKWEGEESERAIAELKKEGKWLPGLDSNNKALAYIGKERNRRLKEIQQKYK